MDYSKIVDLVKEAGTIVFDETLRTEIKMKGEADFVTAVDTKISTFLKEKLAVLTPDIGFMSEEEDYELEPVRWILDPIDGTTNLVYGYNLSSVSLALCDHEEIVFGVVHNPYNQETFIAEKGKGATFNGKPLPACPDREPADSLIEFGAGSTRKHQAELAFSIGREVFENFLDVRRMCSSALAVCYVACGRLGGYFEKKLKPWDIAAGTLILEECGGKAATWEGDPVPFDKPSSYVCGAPKSFEKLCGIIKKYNQES